MDYTWLILFIPLFSAIIITLFTRSYPRLSGYISCGAILSSFFLSLKPLTEILQHDHWEPVVNSMTWISLPGFTVEFGTLIDPLSVVMLMVVGGVGSAIHIYSMGYMHGDKGYSRFFACMSLFTFSMLGIVLATNFIQIFIFWELVGVSSYLLIGYYYQKSSAAEAGKKAFLVNRVGDFGFMAGILVLFFTVKTFDFVELEQLFQVKDFNEGFLVLAGLLILCGAIGKSAQFPLHVWLPDAMEGPTPVSALIHAATMVAAGVYLIARAYFLFHAAEATLVTIAWIGGITAIFAASIALVQTDIKRVLAYSTLSQLGYMVLALGVGGYTAGMFHLTTHAFFKALLFLGAGSVIHAVGTQNIWEMGGLLKKMKVTGWTFLIASAAIAGIPPFAGFWSKDEILNDALNSHLPTHSALYAMAVIAAFMTAFYMARLCIIVFLGNQRNKKLHPHESPRVMTYPLMFLAFLSIVGGFMGFPWLKKNFSHYIHFPGTHHVEFSYGVAGSSVVIALLGILLAYFIYYKRSISAEKISNHFRISYRLLTKKYYFDEFYLWIVEHVQQNFARLCNWWDQTVLIEGMVNGTAGFTRWTANIIRFSQTGNLQNYALIIISGVVLIILLTAIL